MNIEIFYLAAYTFGIAIHIVALVFGLMAWKCGDELFVKSSPSSIFTSKIEKKFWLVSLGTMMNIIFLIIMPFYIIEFNANTAGWLEPWFCLFHVGSSITTALWHEMTYNDIKGMIGCKDLRRP